MQITLNQDEILSALETYVRSKINVAPNQDIEIDLKAGRGENGFTATLEIVPSKSKTTRSTSSSPTSPAAEPEAPAKPVFSKAAETVTESSDEVEVVENEADEATDAADEKPTHRSIFQKSA